MRRGCRARRCWLTCRSWSLSSTSARRRQANSSVGSVDGCPAVHRRVTVSSLTRALVATRRPVARTLGGSRGAMRIVLGTRPMRRCGSTTEVVLHIGHRRRRRVNDVVVRMRVVVHVPSQGLRAHTRRTTRRQRQVRRRPLVCARFELGEGVPPRALQLDARKRPLGAHGSEFSLRAGAPVLEARLELRAGPPAVENDRSARRWRDPRTLLRVGRLGVQVRAVDVLLVELTSVLVQFKPFVPLGLRQASGRVWCRASLRRRRRLRPARHRSSR